MKLSMINIGEDPDRENTGLLCAIGMDEEVRAAQDDTGSLVIWWFTKNEDGSWSYDMGAKIPKQGLSTLTELLINHL